MKDQIGIVYSSVDGQTKKICKELVRQLTANHFKVRMYPIEHFRNFANFQSLIIGASVRYGKHNPAVENFITRNRKALANINTAFFSVNLVARKEEKSTKDTNPYLIKFLQELDWHPDLVDVFAGKLDYSIYPFFDKLLVKMIMKFTHGPTSTKVPIEYTDWERVRQFGEAVMDLNKMRKSSA